MMQKEWWKKAIAYQVYPRSFMDSNGDGIGDLQGIISKLDYLKDLGIEVIWLCPVYASPNDDNGYDISDYHQIMKEFGTMEDFDELLEKVHQKGMKLIMDLVINHTSDEHAWFIESRSSKDNPKRDWYIWHKPVDGKEPNNWASIFGGSAWQYDKDTKEYYLHLFSTKQPDLNWEKEEVREALYEMVNTWLDKGIDGFRIDAISHIKKAEGLPDIENPGHLDYVPSFSKHMNQPGILDFLKELKENTFSQYDIMTVGEANGVAAREGEAWASTEGAFDMIFQFEHLHLWETGEEKTEGLVDILHVKKALSKWQKALQNKGWNALFLENHDLPRVVSRLGNDTVYWNESAKALGLMYFMMQGTPFIYQGQEIGMTNVQFESIEDYRDLSTKATYNQLIKEGKTVPEVMEVIWKSTRDNSRTPMQWNSSQNAGFTTGVPWFGINPNYKEINVEKQQGDPYSVFNFYKQMIKIKKANPVLCDGLYESCLEEDKDLVVYTRIGQHEGALIICNLSERVRDYTHEGIAMEYKNLLLSNYAVGEDEKVDSISLKPYEARLYSFPIHR